MKKTFFLALVLLGLAAFFYFYEIKGGENRKRSEILKSKLFPLDREALSAILIEKNDLLLEKIENSWLITRPMQSKTEDKYLNQLLNSIANSKKQELDSELFKHPEQFGLTDTSPRIIITHANGIDTLIVGDKNPTNAFVYVRKNSQPDIYLTSASLYYDVRKEFNDLRTKKVLEFENSDVTKIRLTVNNQKYLATHDGTNWRLQQPIQAAADVNKINLILNTVKNARRLEFVDDHPQDLKKYGLKTAAIKVELFFNNESTPFVFRIGGKSNRKYFANASTEETVFLVNKNIYDAYANLNLFELRRKDICDFDPTKATRVIFHVQSKEKIVNRDPAGKWSFVSPEINHTQKGRFNRLFDILKNLKAAKFIDDDKISDEQFGFDNSPFQIKVYEQGSPRVSLTIGKEKKQLTYIKNNDSVFLVKKSWVDKLKLFLSGFAEEIQN